MLLKQHIGCGWMHLVNQIKTGDITAIKQSTALCIFKIGYNNFDLTSQSIRDSDSSYIKHIKDSFSICHMQWSVRVYFIQWMCDLPGYEIRKFMPACNISCITTNCVPKCRWYFKCTILVTKITHVYKHTFISVFTICTLPFKSTFCMLKCMQNGKAFEFHIIPQQWFDS